jgi:hypothetical protein
MRKILSLLGALASFGLVLSPLEANALVDYSLLVGEWSEPGACNRTRYIYTLDNRYFLLKKKGGEWTTEYAGIYIPLLNHQLAFLEEGNTGAIRILDKPGTAGFIFTVRQLTPTIYKSELYSDSNGESESIGEKYNWVKCPNR